MFKIKNLSIIALSLFLMASNANYGNVLGINGINNISVKEQINELDNFSIKSTETLNPDWMANLPEAAGGKKLRDLVIPGTHDSLTYNISQTSQMASDNPVNSTLANYEALKEKVHNFLSKDKMQDSLLKKFISGWSKAQSKTAYEQLMAGIRYFDLRVLRRATDGEMFIVHGMYSVNIDTVISDISRFIKEHPKEIIILDFNHLYNMNSGHEILIKKLNDAFGNSKFIPRSKTVNTTLNQLWQAQQQIIALYDDKGSVNNHPELWSQEDIVSPWANKQDIWGLKTTLQEIMNGNKIYNRKTENFDCPQISEYCQKISKDKFFVLQGIITEDPKMILESLPLFYTVNKAQEALDNNTGDLESINKKMDEVTDKFNKAPFFIKPFYNIQLSSLLDRKRAKEVEVATAKFILKKAQKDYAKKPRSLRDIASTTTPFISDMLKGEWSDKDINIVITDWYELSDYVNTIIELNRKKS
jgi:hypothetical protein